MKDMFYNYDNNIDKKEYPHPIFFPEQVNILDSTNNVKLISDIKGNEIGVEVKQNTDFDLYFTLETIDCDCCLDELVLNSSVIFELKNRLHTVMFSKSVQGAEVYCPEINAIKLHFNDNELANLKRESYDIHLMLIWPDGKYELFTDGSGKLILR